MDRRHLSSTEKIPAKKPCDRDRLLEWTLMTKILCLMVTAVGRFGLCMKLGLRVRNRRGSCPGVVLSSSAVESGKIMVPLFFGFMTFLMRMGILARMTCSMVN